MSVGTRRLAAAQRTAVGTSPSRARRLGAWIVIVPALSLFSFSVVAGAAGFNGKPDVAGAAARIVPAAHGDGRTGQGGGIVQVGSGNGGAFDALSGKAAREVCWLSKSQLARVAQVYRTTTTTIRVGRTTYTIVTVYGASERDLRNLLGPSGMQCRIVQGAHLFFFPFDPNLS